MFEDNTVQTQTEFQIRLLRSDLDKCFLRGRRSLEDCMPFFNHDLVGFRSYMVAVQGEEVLGMLAFVEESNWMPRSFGVGFISTHLQHREQGVASTLVRELFKLAFREGKGIVMTPVEPAVREFFEPALATIAAAFPAVQYLQRR